MEEEIRSLDRRAFLQRAGVAVGAAAAAGFLSGCNGEAESTEGGAEAEPGSWAFGGRVDEIRKRGKLVIACGMRVPPQNYLDKDTNEPKGFDVELAKILAADLEVDLEWEMPEFAAYFPGLMAGKYDIVITGIANKPERALSMQFTRGYVPYDQVLLVRTDLDAVHWSDVNKAGLKVTAQLGATGEFKARELFPEAEIAPFTNPEFMLEVAAGRADAALTEAYLGFPFAINNPGCEVLLDAQGEAQVLAREWGCFPVALGEHAFMHYLDNWLVWYQERGTLGALYDKIMGPALRGEVYWD
jgi:polar amino acid transport system substrate-binding protein